jgi:Ni/Co efflux regulator RcnB
MKTLFLTVAATALLFAAPAALAQDDHHGDKHPGGAPHETHAAAPAHTMHAAPPSHAAAPNAMMSGPAMSGHASPGHHSMTTTNAAPPKGWTAKGQGHPADNAMHGNNNAMHGNNNAMRGGNNAIRGNNNAMHGNANAMRGGNNHANFNRRNVTASHHYHYRGGAYHGPRGYSYHRYAYGQTLPSIFWAQNYWINDYSDYGLSYPPAGCVWVRYGDDAILIDQYSGEILEVVYDQFD